MIQVKKWRLVFVCLLTLVVCSVLQAQDRTIVISGSVVTPEKVLNKGWVVIKHKKISAVDKYKQQIATPARTIQDDPQGFCDIAELVVVNGVPIYGDGRLCLKSQNRLVVL